MRGAIPPLPHVFMAWCLLKLRENFTFTLPIEFFYVFDISVSEDISYRSLKYFHIIPSGEFY
jgi:hypothetical protein